MTPLSSNCDSAWIFESGLKLVIMSTVPGSRTSLSPGGLSFADHVVFDVPRHVTGLTFDTQEVCKAILIEVSILLMHCKHVQEVTVPFSNDYIPNPNKKWSLWTIPIYLIHSELEKRGINIRISSNEAVSKINKHYKIHRKTKRKRMLNACLLFTRFLLSKR